MQTADNQHVSANAALEAKQSKWYVLRCFYGKELVSGDQIKELFGVECFIPIRKTRQRGPKGRFVWVRHCALSGYVFVHTDKESIVAISRRIPNVHIMMRPKEGIRVYTVVPDVDMASFIRVSGSREQQIMYLDPSKLNFRPGDRVRVIGGPFVGVEGTFMQIGGKHEKRVVIQLSGLIAVATAAVPASMVERIPVVEDDNK